MNTLSKIFSSLLISFLLLVAMSSCTVIGGIFKAGVWAGVLMVVAVVGIIIFIVVKMSSSGKSS